MSTFEKSKKEKLDYYYKKSYPSFIENKNQFLKAYWWMLLARTVENKLAKLYRANKVPGGVYVGKGQEALSASIGINLDASSEQIFAPLIRDQAGRLAFGEPLEDCIRTYLGSKLGPMKGRDGNVHRGRPTKGLLPMISHLGSMISVCNGILFAKTKIKKTSSNTPVAVACIGEGGTSTGSFHEALNMASVEKLPLVVVVANNQYAYSTPTNRQFNCETLSKRAQGYGMDGYDIDGTSLDECLDTLKKCISKAQKGIPQLIVAKLLRLSGHGEHDDAKYIDDKLKKLKHGIDCLVKTQENIVEKNLLTKDELVMWQDKATEMVEKSVNQVLQEQGPNPREEEWFAISSNFRR